ncbi:enoyl-CoA hydratase/isomerase family protein [Kineococcus radiotolerans]|uniref:enoyl-CoA hydratase/isomerase family protein n=1 Tax=Kineococcus radiotolerans TaxID=131568 RepID=UPI00160B217F
MALGDHSTLRVSINHGVATITLDNPPVNVLSAVMMRELHEVLNILREDPTAKVIVFESADPHFFLAHVDMTIAERMDILQQLAATAAEGVNVFQLTGELIRHQPQVTIVKLTGTARGGGAEFVAAADMTFAAAETAQLGQVEALMGITPGGGATQYLPDKVGRNRALEIILTGDLYDASTAAGYGWINRALPAGELDAHVDRVAHQIATLPDGVVAAAKHAMPPTEFGRGLITEDEAWASLVGSPAAQQLMTSALQRGAQTPDGERDLEGLLRNLLP